MISLGRIQLSRGEVVDLTVSYAAHLINGITLGLPTAVGFNCTVSIVSFTTPLVTVRVTAPTSGNSSRVELIVPLSSGESVRRQIDVFLL